MTDLKEIERGRETERGERGMRDLLLQESDPDPNLHQREQTAPAIRGVPQDVGLELFHDTLFKCQNSHLTCKFLIVGMRFTLQHMHVY